MNLQFLCRVATAGTVSVCVAGLLFSSGCNNSPPPAARASTVTLQIVHGPETRAVLGALRDKFNQSQPSLADGSIVRVDLVNDMGLSAAMRLARGELKSDGWVAPSTTLVRFSNGSRINLGPEQGNCVPLFFSPVVAAVRTDQTDLVGAVSGEFSWKSFMRAVQESGESKGKISFAHTQPRSAVTGFASLIQLAYLSAQAASISVADLRSGAAGRELSKMESLVFAYPLSESFLLAKSAHSAPANLRFALTTEQQVSLYNHNRSADSPELASLLIKEGSYLEDYQLCTSLADWVTPARQAGFQLFSKYAQSREAQGLAQSAGFRISQTDSSDSSQLSEPSAGSHAPPTPLQTIFPPLSYDVASHLLEEWAKYRRPAALTVVIDRSGSMDGDSLLVVKEQLRSLLAQVSSQDKVALIMFGSDVKMLRDFSNDTSQLLSDLDTIQAVGGSALYSAIAQSIEKAGSAELDAYRRLVLVVTDGDDKNSDISLTTLSKMVERLVPAHGIELSIVGIARQGTDFSDLERVAQAADGNFRSASLMELGAVFQDLAKGL